MEKKNARSDGIELKKIYLESSLAHNVESARGHEKPSVIETENLISGNLSKMI